MSTYRVEWPCCGSATETQAWEPEQCPFCEPDNAATDPALLALAKFGAMVASDCENYMTDGIETPTLGILMVRAGVLPVDALDDDPFPAGIASAIAALLAPAGAASEGVTR